MKDIQISLLLSNLRSALHQVVRYSFLAVFLFFSLVYIIQLLLLNQFYNEEPTSAQINAQAQSVQSPRVDQATLNKLQQLQDQNIQVKSLFDQARQNPFSE